MSALERILALAKEGLPIVLVGEVPTASAFYGANWKGQEQEIVTLCRQLCTLKNVTRVADEASVPAALKAFGIRPALEPQKLVNLLSVHRRIDQTDLLYPVPWNSGRKTVAIPGRKRPRYLVESLEWKNNGAGCRAGRREAAG